MLTPELVTPATLRAWALPAPGQDKEERGRLVVLGGGCSTPGAVRLAGEAGLHAGAGKLALLTTAATTAALGTVVPEAAVMGLVEDDGWIAPAASDEIVRLVEGAAALLVGPGFGDPERSSALLERVLPRVDLPVVLDGVASAYLAEWRDGLAHLRGRLVLTVNPSELARTAGEAAGHEDPMPLTVDLARQHGLVVLCGGESKCVAAPDGASWLVEGGGPGLGVSGSGDVQAGIVAGMVARGADPAQAAVWGAYVHARCGERLAADVGAVGFLARQLPAQVTAVLREIG